MNNVWTGKDYSIRNRVDEGNFWYVQSHSLQRLSSKDKHSYRWVPFPVKSADSFVYSVQPETSQFTTNQSKPYKHIMPVWSFEHESLQSADTNWEYRVETFWKVRRQPKLVRSRFSSFRPWTSRTDRARGTCSFEVLYLQKDIFRNMRILSWFEPTRRFLVHRRLVDADGANLEEGELEHCKAVPHHRLLPAALRVAAQLGALEVVLQLQRESRLQSARPPTQLSRFINLFFAKKWHKLLKTAIRTLCPSRVYTDTACPRIWRMPDKPLADKFDTFASDCCRRNRNSCSTNNKFGGGETFRRF